MFFVITELDRNKRFSASLKLTRKALIHIMQNRSVQAYNISRKENLRGCQTFWATPKSEIN